MSDRVPADRVLLVEDRDALRAMLARHLSATWDVDAASDGNAALRLLETERYAVVVTDVRLPGPNGHAVLAAARALPNPPEVILMTAFAEVPAAVAALRAGAYDYIAKPFEPEDLARAVARAADRFALVHRARELEAVVATQHSGLLGVSPGMVEVRRLIDRVGPLPVPVLLTGESGTGKEIAAKELHRAYGKGPFVAVNCGAIPEALLEAELFGVARGAFTGAHQDRAGLFETADGGTLFLDEIAELPLSLQVKLNRALEEGEIRRVGESRARQVHPRVIAATHRDLEARIAEGSFRADLFYRLKVVCITLPPLRERREDIPILTARFLQIAAARLGTRARRLSIDALAALEAAPWPGNVRELRHSLEHAAVMAEGETIEVQALPEPFRAAAPVLRAGTWREAMERAQEQAGRAFLEELLRRHRGNVSHAAEDAGIERESLYRLVRRHGLDPARFRL